MFDGDAVNASSSNWPNSASAWFSHVAFISRSAVCRSRSPPSCTVRVVSIGFRDEIHKANPLIPPVRGNEDGNMSTPVCHVACELHMQTDTPAQATPQQAPISETMLSSIKHHWPEYLMESWALGTFMISACVFGVLLEHPASPVSQAIENPFF